MAFRNGFLQALDSLVLHLHLYDKAIQSCRTNFDAHSRKLWHLVPLCFLY